MGAPMRITWSLLSLSFLFISVCSNTDSQNATGVVVGQNGPSPTDKSKITLSPTTKKPTAAVSAPTMTATSKPHTDGTQVSNVTNNPSTAAASTTAASSTAASAAAASAAAASAAAASTAAASTAAASTAAASTAAAATAAAATAAASTAAAATAAAATAAASTAAASTTAASAAAASTAAASTAAAPTTTSPPKTIRADSSGVSVTLSAPTRLTMNTSGPDDTSGTGAPVGSSGSVGKTEISKVSTGVFTSGQQSVTDTTIATKTSQDSRGTKKTTAVAAVPGWPGSRPTEPAGNPVTTSTPSTLTKAGPNRPPLVPTAGTTQTPTTTTITNTSTTTCTTEPQLKTFLYSLNNGHELQKEEEKYLAEVCRCLMVNFEDGNCTLTLKHNPLKIQFAEITGKVKTSLVNQCSENITKIPTANKTLIAILASCGALLIMIVILVVCVSHRRRPYNDNQQHLTEELHTVENGYHDNPTLEVMEVQPEMQEKKVALNGEFNDSWIVPIDNLLKGDVADEEDTHL